MVDAEKINTGRPTSFNDSLTKQAEEYLLDFDLEQNEREGFTQHEVIPSIVGLCRYIKRGKTTIYNWLSDKDENKNGFRDICNAILEMQEVKLLSGGLVGGYNPQVTKMILAKHGYSDKVDLDHSSKDKTMSPTGFNDFYSDDEPKE